MKFLMIEQELLKNRAFNTAEKLILAYLISLQKQGKGYWGSNKYMAEQFGTTEAGVENVFQSLLEKKIIFRDSENTIRLSGSIKSIYSYAAPSLDNVVVAKNVQESLADLAGKFAIKNGGYYGTD